MSSINGQVPISTAQDQDDRVPEEMFGRNEDEGRQMEGKRRRGEKKGRAKVNQLIRGAWIFADIGFIIGVGNIQETEEREREDERSVVSHRLPSLVPV